MFNTSLINEKATKNTRGIQVVRMKKGQYYATIKST